MKTMSPKDVLVALATFFAFVSAIGVLVIQILLKIAESNKKQRSDSGTPVCDAAGHTTFHSSTVAPPATQTRDGEAAYSHV